MSDPSHPTNRKPPGRSASQGHPLSAFERVGLPARRLLLAIVLLAMLVSGCGGESREGPACAERTYPTLPAASAPQSSGGLTVRISPNLGHARQLGFGLLAGHPPFCVDFQAQAFESTGNLSYQWDFDGDGEVDSQAPDPSPFQYQEAGEYLATVIVQDESGAEATAEQRIVVIGEPQYPDWRYGVNAHLAWFPGVYEDGKASSKAASWISEMGVDVVRGGVDWHTIQPENGDEFYWSRYDFLFALTAIHELGLLPILAYSSPWATLANQSYQGGDRLKYGPEIHAFAWFAYQAAARYRGRATAWEIWNEPNLGIFWQPEPDPLHYANLVRETYLAVKYGDPEAIVVLGSLSNDISKEVPDLPVVPPEQFLQILYDQGVGSHFDVVARNPYAHPSLGGQAVAGMLQAMREVMRENGDGRKPLWVTETGYASIPEWGVPEDVQAAWLLESARAALEQGGASLYTWYNFRDKGDQPDEFDHNLGLIRRDWTRKPAFDAYQQLIHSD